MVKVYLWRKDKSLAQLNRYFLVDFELIDGVSEGLVRLYFLVRRPRALPTKKRLQTAISKYLMQSNSAMRRKFVDL